MTEEDRTYQHLAYRRKPLWRRVRKSTGETWQPNMSLLDFRNLGIICKECHKRIKWKDLDCGYEMQGDSCMRIWFCGFCGQALREDNITLLAMHYEHVRRTTVHTAKGGELYEE